MIHKLLHYYLVTRLVQHIRTAVAAAKRRCIKRGWTEAEKCAVRAELGDFYYRLTLPGKNDIMRCIHLHPLLKNRSWKNIKDYIRNIQLRNSKPTEYVVSTG